MRWSQAHIFTLRESPSEAELISHQLMIRAGLIKKVAPGIYTYGSLCLRALRKFENLIREELNKRGCTEILMPMVHPRELWEETSRWQEMGMGLLKFKNRNDHWFCLGATHEEVITDFVRFDIKSYRDLPRNLYQIQTKFRDEIRPRFGLLRGREFIMKDAYSFDATSEKALEAYWRMYDAYKAIFTKLGVEFRIVEADAGNIGGSLTHEFQLLSQAGEDELLVSDKTEFAANKEVCPVVLLETEQSAEPELPLEKFATPGIRTIDDLSRYLGVPRTHLVKTLFFSANDGSDPNDKALKPFALCLLGSDEANPIKLKNTLGLVNPPTLMNDQEVKQFTGASLGSCGPVGLKIPILVDQAVARIKNFIAGANEDGFHLRNVCIGRDFEATQVGDFRFARAGDLDPTDPTGRLQLFRGIELGHVFYLGTKYSKKMKANFLDPQGKEQPLEMGCYGIGVSRTIQAVIEQSHDRDGIIWPLRIAPFSTIVSVLDPEESQIQELALEIEKGIEAAGFDVLVDDREERPGVKFKDADLLGFPFRINLGKKSFDKGKIELLHRKTKVTELLSPGQVLPRLIERLKEGIVID